MTMITNLAIRKSDQTGISLEAIRAVASEKWSKNDGASFRLGDWNFRIPTCNMMDVWATKAGTQGKTRKTFCRFSLRDGN